MKTVSVTEAIGWGGDHHCTVTTIPGVSVMLSGAVPGHRQGACDEHDDCRADFAKNPTDPKLAIECRKRGQFLHRFVVGDSARHSEFALHGTIVSIRERLIIIRSGTPSFHHSINDWVNRDLRMTTSKLVRLRLPKFALLNWNTRKEPIRPASLTREYVIGFGPAVVLARATEVFQAQPQVVFRGTRLIIPSTIAENFQINDIRVGRDSQAISTTPIPATAFSELAVGVSIGLDTATPGILLTLSVTNITSQDQTFSAALIGTTLDAEEQSPYLQDYVRTGLALIPDVILSLNYDGPNYNELGVMPSIQTYDDSNTITMTSKTLTASPAALSPGFYPTLVGVRNDDERDERDERDE